MAKETLSAGFSMNIFPSGKANYTSIEINNPFSG